jgi:Fe2+ or Zn2+ uptake regulation protein
MEKIIDNLRNKGLRITSSRRSVLYALYHSRQPLTLQSLHERCGNIDFTTVYRNVLLFMEAGIAQEVRLGEKAPMYALKEESGHNHYIKCEKCGTIQELHICFLDIIKEKTGFKINSHSMEFIGICPDCLEQ